MRIRSSGHASSMVLIVLVIFYILLIGIIILFFQQIILTMYKSNPFTNIMIFGIIIILPVGLLVAIIYSLIRLLRERAMKKSGARFKTRLILFFSFIALLAAVPQTTLSVTFINSVINSEFVSRLNEVVNNAWSIAVDYYTGKSRNLETFGKSSLLPYILRELPYNPEQTWLTLHNANPEIQFLQVFGPDNREILFKASNPVADAARISDFSGFSGQLGKLPKDERGDISIFRYLYKVPYGNKNYYAMFGLVLPRGFDQKTKQLAESREFFAQLSRYKDIFEVVIVIFYSLFSFPILLLAILVSFFLAEEIVRPIFNLEEATERVAQGDFSIRILSRSGDELSNLIQSFNRMVSELEISKKKLLQAEKIAAWQEIAKRLAHEIKNPLTPIKLSAERIQKKYEEENQGNPKELKKVIESSVSAIIGEVQNLNKLLKDFSDFAKLPEPKRENVNLKKLIREAVALYRTTAPNIRFDIKNIDQNTTVFIDYNQFKQVFTNLIINALQAMPGGGLIFIRADLVKKEKTNYCRIQVQDSGDGIDEAIKQSIFDPYFTTKKGGAGLGLSIVERIVFDHKGNIWFESQKGRGTTFFIDIPMEQD
jgi:two-component system nitrogen regulation sensor histidine kinase NtrY